MFITRNARVEVDLKLQSQTAKFLRASKHEVTIFTNTINALAFAQAEQFDILLCDQRLEHSPSGLTLAAQVRNLYPACPIVMVSSFATVPEISRGYEIDVDAYVPRPIRLEELLEKLYDAVERRRAKFPQSETRIICGPLMIDQAQRTATWHGNALDLTPSELKVLIALASEPGRVISVPDLCGLTKGRGGYKLILAMGCGFLGLLADTHALSWLQLLQNS